MERLKLLIFGVILAAMVTFPQGLRGMVRRERERDGSLDGVPGERGGLRVKSRRRGRRGEKRRRRRRDGRERTRDEREGAA